MTLRYLVCVIVLSGFFLTALSLTLSRKMTLLIEPLQAMTGQEDTHTYTALLPILRN